jgi:hypothetical protein
MKITITEPNKDIELKYPLFARSRDNKSVVVLFTDVCTGIVVSQNDDVYKLGYYSTNWQHIDCWEILPSGTEIKLIQE